MSSPAPDTNVKNEGIVKNVTEKKKPAGTRPRHVSNGIQKNILHSQRIKSDFICDMKSTNRLPMIPCEPKFMKMDTYSNVLKDVSNSDVLKTHKYPVYPPIVPLPFIGYDPISKNHFTKNDETQPEDLALLSSSLASFTDVSGTERPISSYTGHFLREVEYNDGMIFSARNVDPNSLIQNALDVIREPLPLAEEEKKESKDEAEESLKNEQKIKEILEEFKPFVVPANRDQPQLKPKRVYDVYPDTPLFDNHYLLGKFEDKTLYLFDKDHYTSVIIRPYQRKIQPSLRTQAPIIQDIGEILKVSPEDKNHYVWNHTYTVNIVDKINKYIHTDNYLWQYDDKEVDTIAVGDEGRSVPVSTVTYAPIDSNKIMYLKKTEDGDLAKTDIIIERVENDQSNDDLDD